MDDDNALEATLQHLLDRFPTVPVQVITRMLAESYVVVATAAGEPRVTEVEKLATLRLEVHNESPAVPELEVEAVHSPAEDRAVVRARASRVAAEAERTCNRAALAHRSAHDLMNSLVEAIDAARRRRSPHDA